MFGREDQFVKDYRSVVYFMLGIAKSGLQANECAPNAALTTSWYPETTTSFVSLQLEVDMTEDKGRHGGRLDIRRCRDPYILECIIIVCLSFWSFCRFQLSKYRSQLRISASTYASYLHCIKRCWLHEVSFIMTIVAVKATVIMSIGLARCLTSLGPVSAASAPYERHLFNTSSIP